MVLLWKEGMLSLHFLCPTLPSICIITRSHLHIASHSSIPAALSQNPSWKDNIVRLTLYNTWPSSKRISATLSWDKMQSQFFNSHAQDYTDASYGSINTMTGTGATWPFVANILNICQYQLSVHLSDTLQIFKVRFETPGGLQGSGVCAAKKQWNQWHGAKWREVRAPPYCDLVALNSSLFLSRSVSHLQRHRSHGSVQRHCCKSCRWR